MIGKKKKRGVVVALLKSLLDKFDLGQFPEIRADVEAVIAAYQGEDPSSYAVKNLDPLLEESRDAWMIAWIARAAFWGIKNEVWCDHARGWAQELLTGDGPLPESGGV